VKLAELEAVGMRGTVAVCESEPGVVDLSKEVTHQYEKARPREQKGKGEPLVRERQILIGSTTIDQQRMGDQKLKKK
jgi:hypothetical protein